MCYNYRIINKGADLMMAYYKLQGCQNPRTVDWPENEL